MLRSYRLFIELVWSDIFGNADYPLLIMIYANNDVFVNDVGIIITHNNNNNK